MPTIKGVVEPEPEGCRITISIQPGIYVFFSCCIFFWILVSQVVQDTLKGFRQLDLDTVMFWGFISFFTYILPLFAFHLEANQSEALLQDILKTDDAEEPGPFN